MTDNFLIDASLPLILMAGLWLDYKLEEWGRGGN